MKISKLFIPMMALLAMTFLYSCGVTKDCKDTF